MRAARGEAVLRDPERDAVIAERASDVANIFEGLGEQAVLAVVELLSDVVKADSVGVLLDARRSSVCALEEVPQRHLRNVPESVCLLGLRGCEGPSEDGDVRVHLLDGVVGNGLELGIALGLRRRL